VWLIFEIIKWIILKSVAKNSLSLLEKTKFSTKINSKSSIKNIVVFFGVDFEFLWMILIFLGLIKMKTSTFRQWSNWIAFRPDKWAINMIESIYMSFHLIWVIFLRIYICIPLYASTNGDLLLIFLISFCFSKAVEK